MKFTVAFLAFFGTLAMGQNKPMDTDFYQNIKYVFDYRTEQEYTLPVENIDISELNQFCENVGDADGIPRTLKILEDYDDDDPRNLYFTCLIADDTDDIRITVSGEDTRDEPVTIKENIPTETTESEKAAQRMTMFIIDSDLKPTFYYVVHYGDKDLEMPIAAPVHRMSDLPTFCRHPFFFGGKKLIPRIIARADDPSNVYFFCESPKEGPEVPLTVPTTEDTPDEPTTEQIKPAVVDPELQQRFFYIDFERGINITLLQIKRMSDLTPFCRNREYWNGEKRKVNIIEVNDDPRKVYFTCVVAEDDDDVPTEPAVPTPTEPGNPDVTVRPYKFIGKGYKYNPSIDAWMKVYLKPENWQDARLRCLHEGSTLASPLDPQMLKAMKGLLGKKVSVAFTGISADYAPGYFYSVEGVSLDEIPANFAPGSPEITQGSDGCIGMYPNGTLTMLRCYIPKPFICYVKDSDVPEIKSPCGSDPDYKYERRTGKCYKFHTVGKTWSSAFMTCASEGGHLAIINSDKESQAVVELVNKFPESAERSDYPGIILLGFRDWSEHKTWMTIHGQTLQKAGYSRWGPREPSDPRSEFCGSMFRNGELNDTLCRSAMAFVCEKKPAVPVKGISSTSDSSYRL